jgi:hypothetical protein
MFADTYRNYYHAKDHQNPGPSIDYAIESHSSLNRLQNSEFADASRSYYPAGIEAHSRFTRPRLSANLRPRLTPILSPAATNPALDERFFPTAPDPFIGACNPHAPATPDACNMFAAEGHRALSPGLRLSLAAHICTKSDELSPQLHDPGSQGFQTLRRRFRQEKMARQSKSDGQCPPGFKFWNDNTGRSYCLIRYGAKSANLSTHLLGSSAFPKRDHPLFSPMRAGGILGVIVASETKSNPCAASAKTVFDQESGEMVCAYPGLTFPKSARAIRPEFVPEQGLVGFSWR